MMMKVQYTFPIRGKLRKRGSGEIPLQNWLFRFETAPDADYIERLVVEISDIPKENWPTLIVAKQDPESTISRFPFDTNPEAHSFRDIEPQLLNLESYLSVFGLEEILFSEVSVEWIPDNSDVEAGMLTGYSMCRGRSDDPAEPLSNQDLARCIIASNARSNEAAGLAHYRVAQSNFREGRYIETVRHTYLCLEQLYAGGKHRERATVREFLKSRELTSAIEKMCFKDTAPDIYFSRLKIKYAVLKDAVTVEDIVTFLFRLRGDLQHAKPSANAKWHPSRQQEFEHEALFLINLAGDLCFDIAIRAMRSVPVCNPDD